MMFKRLSILTVIVLGVSILLTTSTVHAQRGGFGRGGFGRGGFGGGHGSGHNGSASVRVNVGTFFPPFRTGPEGNFSRGFSPRVHASPFSRQFGFRGPFFFGHGFPFGFVVTDGLPLSVSPFGSGLGSPIPPLVSQVPIVAPFFFGVQTGSSRVFPTVVDLGTINPIKTFSIDRAQTSNVTIVNIPTDAFRRSHH